MDDEYFQNWGYYDPIPDPEFQAISPITYPINLVQENEIARNLFDKGDFAALYDYAYNYFRNLSHSQSTETKPFTQNNWIQSERQPDLPAAVPDGEVHLKDSNSKPFPENPLMINPNDHGNIAAEYHHQPPIPVPFTNDRWIKREGKRHKPSPNPEMNHDASGSNSMNNMQSIHASVDHETNVEKHVQTSWDFISKLGDDVETSNPSEEESESEGPTRRRSRIDRLSMEWKINGIEIDTPKIPIPVCSCTGTPQKCYRWGKNGWQSACCTATISKYPLPMSTIRRGTKIAGRKMSRGTFKHVLEQLLSKGHNLAIPIDLKTYWGKHGTNQFRARRTMSELLAAP